MVQGRSRRRQQGGFTLIELLIVVAILGTLSSIAIPTMLRARKRAEITALLAEVKTFQQALVLFAMDHAEYPLEDDFDRRTLEPLVSQGYLKDNSLVSYCRDGEIHKYDFAPATSELKWHLHPRMAPYDNGAQKIKIEGDGSSIEASYLGEEYTASSILPLIR